MADNAKKRREKIERSEDQLDLFARRVFEYTKRLEKKIRTIMAVAGVDDEENNQRIKLSLANVKSMIEESGVDHSDMKEVKRIAVMRADMNRPVSITNYDIVTRSVCNKRILSYKRKLALETENMTDSTDESTVGEDSTDESTQQNDDNEQGGNSSDVTDEIDQEGENEEEEANQEREDEEVYFDSDSTQSQNNEEISLENFFRTTIGTQAPPNKKTQTTPQLIDNDNDSRIDSLLLKSSMPANSFLAMLKKK